jgi:hypothetical protein
MWAYRLVLNPIVTYGKTLNIILIYVYNKHKNANSTPRETKNRRTKEERGGRDAQNIKVIFYSDEY